MCVTAWTLDFAFVSFFLANECCRVSEPRFVNVKLFLVEERKSRLEGRHIFTCRHLVQCVFSVDSVFHSISVLHWIVHHCSYTKWRSIHSLLPLQIVYVRIRLFTTIRFNDEIYCGRG